MSRQDKATTERNAKTLRELVKRPENKLCADCKRNDPRWASWNLGVFLCIRCSGIHRSMGTHISKVKSVDLDIWTPEQMESIQKWGNRLANLYWEAHLKAGHVPPEHKMESFIRSKYESRRWALEGAPPSDPSELGGSVPEPVPAPATVPTTSRITPNAPQPTSPFTTRQPQAHQLLSSNYNYTNRSASTPVTVQPAAAAPPPAPKAQDDLFTLDFHGPPATASTQVEQPKKDVKQDILSLFSAPPPVQPYNPAAAMNTSALWGQPQAPVQQQQQQQQPPAAAPQLTTMMGNNGVGMWGVSSGWAAPAAPAQPNIWGSPSAQPTMNTTSLFNTSDVWGNPAPAAAPPSNDLFGSIASTTPNTSQNQKKDDVFGDIWGGFK